MRLRAVIIVHSINVYPTPTVLCLPLSLLCIIVINARTVRRPDVPVFVRFSIAAYLFLGSVTAGENCSTVVYRLPFIIWSSTMAGASRNYGGMPAILTYYMQYIYYLCVCVYTTRRDDAHDYLEIISRHTFNKNI